MNPMRVTALVMIVLGGVIAAFAVVGLAAAGGTATGATPAAPSLMLNPWVLFPFAAVAIVGGVGILMFGGKGVIRTRNPAVRR